MRVFGWGILKSLEMGTRLRMVASSRMPTCRNVQCVTDEQIALGIEA